MRRKLNFVFDRFYETSPFRRKGTVLLALVFFYFAFHLITGERGLFAYVRLKGEIDEAKHKSEQIAMDKQNLGHRVVGMRAESLDLDLLEEVARKDLGYARKDEVVYIWK